MTPSATLSKMDEIGSNYNSEVLEWRDMVMKRMMSNGTFDIVYIHNYLI